MDKTRAILFALASAALFGAATPFSKPLLQDISPFMLAGLLYLGAAAFMAVIIAFRWRIRKSPLIPSDRRNRLQLGGAVLFGGLIGPVLLAYGLKLGKAASVAIWLNMETLATVVLAWLFFKEHIGRWTMLGNLGVLAAGVLLCVDGGMEATVGALFVAGAAICWGLDNNLTALIDRISPVESTFWKGSIAGSTNLLIGCLMGGQFSESWAMALGIGTLSYGVSIALYIASAQKLGATRSQMLFSSAPVFGVLLSFLWLGESITYWQLAAGLVLLCSLLVMLLDAHSHEHRHEPLEHDHEHKHDDGHHNHTHDGLSSAHRHSHVHIHEQLSHVHPHWPDLHHRHSH
jgi:drug/metabolite transporter (DMT)-like permease